MDRFIKVLRSEKGIETLEWIVVGALMVAVGIAVYQGALQTALTTTVTNIGTTISGLAG